jgi:Prealbumin-like fold domain
VIAAVLALFGAMLPASAGPVGNASGFEDDDGNLVVNSTFDWNGFAPTTWLGTAPFRTSTDNASGWDFTGVEDAQVTNSDSAFAGGTKQDNNCATVGTGKAPNKDDLKRIYISSSTVNGDVFLNLAWVRIPQNTTSASAHVGFEFNQGETPCPAGSDSLVARTVGDMLIVYDFEGGSGDTPRLTLRRWVDSGPCEVGSSSPPCWGPATDLTAAGFAEGRVNTTTVGSVVDQLAPPAPPATTSVSETLGLNEFGEAGINLTDAGVFDQNECLAFGNAFGVSRSSGNSAQAQMKDLVGPAEVNIANCGQVIIHKVTDPSPDPTDTTFDYTTTGGLDPATFSLKDGGTQDYGNEVFAGSYSVTESDPSADNFELQSLNCDASETDDGTTINIDEATRTVSFNLAAQDVVECTFTNELQTGAIEITKDRKHAADGPGDHPHAGVVFTVTGGTLPAGGTTVTTDADGVACLDGLAFATYTVTETVPAGYVSDDASKDVAVSAVSECGDGNEATVSFHNTPLTNLDVLVDSQVPGGTSSTIDCRNAANQTVANGGPGDDITAGVDNLLPGTYVCTVVIDP